MVKGRVKRGSRNMWTLIILANIYGYRWMKLFSLNAYRKEIESKHLF